jgi:hypothetical protein
LSHPLSDPLDLQLKHLIDKLCVFITLGDSTPRRTRSCSGVTKVVVDIGKFVLPSPLCDLIVETKLDLGDRSERIRVERDPGLCELLNGDVGNLYG